ncbi:gas vesicle protein GvpJ [Haladaptatus sp. NG-SE-30]
MTEPRPTRNQSDLAEMLEILLDKGVVINADIVVTVGETELLGVQLRAAIASFDTAAEYGLEFPEGTDMKRVEEASGREPLEESETVMTVEASGEEETESNTETDDEPADTDKTDEDAEEQEEETEEAKEAEQAKQEVSSENEHD